MLQAIAVDAGSTTAPAIAARLGVSRQGAQKQLDDLVDAELAERFGNPGHRKSPLHTLSKAGLAALSKANRELEASAVRHAVALQPGDADVALRFLSSLSGRIVSDLTRRG